MSESLSNFKRSVTPYVCVENALDALKFYQDVFDAKQVGDLHFDDISKTGKLLHATLNIMGSMIFLCDYFPEFMPKIAGEQLPPSSIGGTSVALHIDLEEPELVDFFVDKAIRAGARLSKSVEDVFWGQRYGRFIDPFGQIWSVGAWIKK